MRPRSITRIAPVLLACMLAACVDQLPSAATSAEESAPALTVIPTTAFASMDGGRDHACGLTSGGLGWCWGRNVYGQLGDSSAAPTLVPVPVYHPSGVTFASLTAGGAHTCALTSAGQAYCWGHNADGRLGDSTYVLPLMPVAVLPLGGVVFTQLSAGDTHTCGLDGSGQGYCWGGNGSGQVGDSTWQTLRISPTAVLQRNGLTFSSIVAGQSHSCGLDGAAGQAYCWGFDGDGALGNGSPFGGYAPTAVQQPGGVTFVSLAAWRHTCALDGAGQAYCWGENAAGQVGDSSVVDRNAPVAVMQPAGVTFASISAGGDHSCALDGSGNAWCWGGDTYGQLGNGAAGASRIPVAVTMPSGVSFVSISADQVKTCALDGVGQSWCWGRNNSGFNQIGDGTNTNRNVPTAVSH
jgi:alpha-tubulin suppressor-like RCC1 family protein